METKMECIYCGEFSHRKEIYFEQDGVSQCPSCYRHDAFYMPTEQKQKEVEVVNLTPHPIVITDGLTFEPSGTVARVDAIQSDAGDINGIPVKKQVFGDITNLPEPQDGTVFIVSAVVLAAAKDKGRTDVVGPDTSNAVRNDKGHIVSVPGFVK